jgi:endonuclease III
VARESKAAKTLRARRIARKLADAYPESACALIHETPFQLLVATVMSAQTTDLAVNKATHTLFADYPTPEEMAQATEADIAAHINGIGLWRAKAKNVRALSQRLVHDFDGKVPADLDALTSLPGVGKKTATAVLGTAFGLAAGVTVDTHMVRINRLLGLTSAKAPDKISADLEALLPPKEWPSYTHRVIDHGRLVCVANRPRCGVCPLADDCKSAYSARAGYRPENDDKEPASARGLSWKRFEAVRSGPPAAQS